MLRTDADVVVYVLKHKEKDGRWATSSLDHFKFADSRWTHNDGWQGGVRRAFSASGECWQRYGIHGALDEKTGMAGLSEIARGNPGHEFGLFQVALSQKTEMIGQMGMMRTPALAA